MKEIEAKREANRIMAEFDSTIRNYGTTSVRFAQIIELSRALRDAAYCAHGLGEERREHAFELMRNAKLLALVQADGQRYLEKLEAVEDDLRRVG